MKNNLLKIFYLLAVICLLFGCLKKENNISNIKSKPDNSSIDTKIKDIAVSQAAFDDMAKTILTEKFDTVVDYSIKQIDIKSIEQFKIAEVEITAAGSEFNYFILTPAVFKEKPQKEKYVLKPVTDMVSNARILVFAAGKPSARSDISYDDSTFTISSRNNTLYFLTANAGK
ncbi:hypothetical protein F0L74_22960 [Chitinophaga agrisoli]|uniref:Uncharacterized protein n=1 Tax=Chitinophaga agrisoli TaxID=2607653 RepID=A0A5B2VJI1_9BACT|nr:hypothetical protein [Chitinophaga agrisoli]KAA2239075.1 hypothetical protein F0L74_22960 [Chitinophaga agrisoli]